MEDEFPVEADSPVREDSLLEDYLEEEDFLVEEDSRVVEDFLVEEDSQVVEDFLVVVDLEVVAQERSYMWMDPASPPKLQEVCTCTTLLYNPQLQVGHHQGFHRQGLTTISSLCVLLREAPVPSLLLYHRHSKKISYTCSTRMKEEKDSELSKYQLLLLLNPRCSSSTMLMAKILNSQLAWIFKLLFELQPTEEDKSSVALELLEEVE